MLDAIMGMAGGILTWALLIGVPALVVWAMVKLFPRLFK